MMMNRLIVMCLHDMSFQIRFSCEELVIPTTLEHGELELGELELEQLVLD